MGLSIPHLLLILIIVFVLFGAGKLPKVMGDIGKGIKSLKEGLKGENEQKIEESKKITAEENKDKNV
ncbi:MAG: twin-arginine translocase TatA/TatE family subunit [Pseudomonadota bacterium]